MTDPLEEEDVSTQTAALSPEEIEAAEVQIVEQSKRIEFYLTEYSVELLADKMKKGDFFVPPYQREFTWEPSRQSRFIESLLMGLPIPFLFFWEDPKTGRLEIVDGSQRLRTIESFIHGDLKLGELEGLTLVSGFRFADLPESRQRKIKNRSIRGIVLNEHADEQARFDLFDRINTGSKIANKAEVRRGALGGPFLDLVVKLADDPLFTQLAPVSPKQFKEREREELVTRFFAYGDGLEGYENKVAPFIYAYTKKMNEAFTADPQLEATYEERFHMVMRFIESNFPLGFRRAPNGKVTPRARFEAIAIGSYWALRDKPTLTTQPVSTAWIDEEEFRDIVGSDGANVIKKLKGRITYVHEQLLNA